MSNFFFDAETNTVVAGNKDSDKVEWEDRKDKFYAEHFGVTCTFDNNEHDNQKLMQFDLSNQFNLDKIPNTNGVLNNDKYSTYTANSGVSAATSVGGVEEDDKDDAKEKENGAVNKNDDGKDDNSAMEYKNNKEKDDNKDKDKSQEEDLADMDQEDNPEEHSEDVPIQTGDAATKGVTTPKETKQTAVISPEGKDNISEKKIIPEK